jgi:ubiquinone/menaquinone biosynthesis C-methylase UbiE
MMESSAGTENRFVDPVAVVSEIGVHAGSKVVDIGAGSGAYVFALSRVVGEDGRVYAIDVQKDMLTRISNEASKRGLKNIDTIWADADRSGGTKLANASVDIVLFSNVLFQLEAKDSALAEAHRILKPTGVLVIIDWTDSFNGMGPHPDEVVTMSEAKRLAEVAGFALKRDFAAGAHHYGILFNNTN